LSQNDHGGKQELCFERIRKMRPLHRLVCCTIVWASLTGRVGAAWEDCPRISLNAEVGVEWLCRNTMAGATNVPLFQAMARLWLKRDVPGANRTLRQAFHDLLDGAPRMTPELADANAKCQMRLWVRTYFLQCLTKAPDHNDPSTPSPTISRSQFSTRMPCSPRPTLPEKTS
jgi:hypothetical protein